ncbi:MAG: efflux RND transporter periplasmic adaptor subunit [Thermoflexibacter sp.]|jgi:multidrug resistance efflux pump|nr:efflux RND transporter periplasmic adaptor subunit [Thermoflexibacter sp.]
MKRKILITTIIVVLIGAVYYFFGRTSSQSEEIYTTVKKGKFTVSVNSSGELFAKSSVNILGPQGINSVGIWQIKISNIIPEGKVVKEGDFVAALDGSELVSRMKDRQTELDKANLQYTQLQIDTTLELRTARDELVNLKYTQEEKKLILQQSKYEPPATIRQAEIEADKTTRNLKQSTENYKIKRDKAIAKMQESSANVEKAQRALEFIQEILQKCNVTAPKSGMVIYARDWSGQKKREGSNVSTWEPVVATLPDMSVMLSKTYVNEVDIQKIKVGQMVNIGLDAFPEKKYTGKIITVANVGEQKPNTDSKVFEVDIEINEKDTTLLPAMTTSNIIVAETLDNVLFIPLESVHNEQGVTYAFKKSGIGLVKQEIKLGKTNDNEAVVLEGLSENEEIMLSMPPNPENIELVRLNGSKGEKKEEKKAVSEVKKQ